MRGSPFLILCVNGVIVNKRSEQKWNINIGTIIFGALALYMIILLVITVTTKHVTPYMVTSGTLSRNETYTAVAVRQEHLVNAQASGYVKYYVPDGARIKQDGVVCSLNSSQQTTGVQLLQSGDLEQLRDLSSRYVKAYTPSNFLSVYDYKYAMNATVLEDAVSTDVTGISSRADTAGIVVYTRDGYEDLTVEAVDDDLFRNITYQKEQLRTDGIVTVDTPLYRLVTDEIWSVVIPVTDRQYASLSTRSTVKVKFSKDGNTERGDIILLEQNGSKFVQIKLYRGMVRYCSDRFLNIELVTNTESGLKLPVSAITHKEFYTIPTAYMFDKTGYGTAHFLKEYTDEEGNLVTDYIEAELYEETEETEHSPALFYVDKSEFQEGDVLVMPDSSERYTIGDTASLEGVYCTNKGYADFRKIVMLEQNDEFCLVESGTSYGIAQFDYIAKEADRIREDTVVTGLAK